VDPKWREEEPGTFHVRPEAVLRLTHDAMRLGMEDLCNKTAKIGSSPIVYIALKDTWEKLNRCMGVHFKSEAVLTAKLGITNPELNHPIMVQSKAIEQLIFSGSKGNHAAGAELMKVMPLWSQDFELLLRNKEGELMGAIQKMGVPALLALMVEVLGAIRSDMRLHSGCVLLGGAPPSLSLTHTHTPEQPTTLPPSRVHLNLRCNLA
jgi:hypothetical protein